MVKIVSKKVAHTALNRKFPLLKVGNY